MSSEPLAHPSSAVVDQTETQAQSDSTSASTSPAVEAPSLPRQGPRATLTAEAILELVPSVVSGSSPARRRWVRDTRFVLSWLAGFPGENWQERWEISGADSGMAWADELAEADPGTTSTVRHSIGGGLGPLLLLRVVAPSYDFLTAFSSRSLLVRLRQFASPTVFKRLETAAVEIGMQEKHLVAALLTTAKLVLHTGRDVDQLTAADVLEYNQWFRAHRQNGSTPIRGVWDLLRKIGVIADVEMPSPRRRGQLTNEQLVDRYGITNPQIRALFIRYLDEQRSRVDYATLDALAVNLCGVFWADIQHHHPLQESLKLSPEAAQAWRERARYRMARPGHSPTLRKDPYAALIAVRAFYISVQELAHEDPYWVPWAASSPVRPQDVEGQSKHKLTVQSEMHQRVRDRLPQLAALADSADSHRLEQVGLLAAAEATPVGETFVFGTKVYRRVVSKSSLVKPYLVLQDRVLIEDLSTGDRIDAQQAEDDAFWAWAVVETLHHTGARLEELLELTQLALISYRVPKTGEQVPMLQIVPSKSNKERLQLITPELANVLATVIVRLQSQNGGAVPLIPRYDPHEKLAGPPLPHLFQRKRGWTSRCISKDGTMRLLNAAAARAGVVDATGQPLQFQPHDFRRMFITDLVANGLPVHIASKIVGHDNIATTQHYMAVFPEEVVTNYRQFLAKRRSTRPEPEYREPTPDEWREFHEHFELRKVELGDCNRAFGTTCPHEHACLKCPMLQVDPNATGRLIRMIKNMEDRLAEAEMYGWGGTATHLRLTIPQAREKLAAAQRSANKPRRQLVDLNVPVFRGTTTS